MEHLPKDIGTVEDILKRFTKAKERRELWRSTYEEAYDYAAPQRETFSLTMPGEKKNRHIFDSTAVDGLSQFASRMQASHMPAWSQWVDLTAGSNVPEDEKKNVNAALEDSTKTFFNALNHSNFDTEIDQSLTDYGIGTGAIMIEEGSFKDDEIFIFTNIPLAELYPEKPGAGPIKTSFRYQSIPIGDIKNTWPNAELSNKMEADAKKEPLKETMIINGMIFNHEDRKYYHVIISEAEKKLLFVQSFNTKRLIIFRYMVSPGECFGRGPILQAMSDIRTVNKVKQFILENGAIQIAGVYTGLDDGIFNPHTVRIAPGTVIPVNSNNPGNPSLSALPRSGDIGLGDLIINDLQTSIEKALFINPIGDVDDPVKSATEIQIRMQEMLKRSGASISRLRTELIDFLVAAGVDILKGRGLMPDITVDGKDVAIKHTSPMAKTEALENFQNSKVWFSSVTELAGITGPEAIMGTVKIEELPSYWAESLGVPLTLVRNKEEQAAVAKQAVDVVQTIGNEGNNGQ